MAQFSPFTRKLVALALLFFSLLGMMTMLILPLSHSLEARLSGLADARFRLAKLEAVAARPELPNAIPPPPGLTISASDAPQACEALRALIASQALRFQVQLESATPAPQIGPQHQVTGLTVALRGPEAQILAFISALETGQPLLRFGTWHLAREGANAGDNARPAPGTAPSLPPPAVPDGTGSPSLSPGDRAGMPGTLSGFGTGATGGFALPALQTSTPNAMPMPPGTIPAETLRFEGVLLAAWERAG
jgi:type IV secretory pathway VirB2 component (pilin)